jgi:hypothetical protein
MNQFAHDVIYGNDSIYEWFDFETMDILLKRDWFIDRESIIQTLDMASQDAWERICKNRNRYSKRIQDVIDPPCPSSKNLKVRFKELSEREWDRMEEDLQKKRDELFERDWAEYSKKIPDRPHNDLDVALDDAWNNFCNSKENLTRYTSSLKKKYVPPGARVKEVLDPQQKKLEDHTREMESKYDMATKAVEQNDAEYWEQMRCAYILAQMPAM